MSRYHLHNIPHSSLTCVPQEKNGKKEYNTRPHFLFFVPQVVDEPLFFPGEHNPILMNERAREEDMDQVCAIDNLKV